MLSVGISSYLIRKKCFCFLNERQNRFSNLDGIRGFLALAVFFHHFTVTYYWKVNGVWAAPDNIILRNLGKFGVAIFFMITGFFLLLGY